MISVLLSVMIESYQAATGTRIGAFADILSNSLGALIGVLAAGAVLMVSGAGRHIRRATPMRLHLGR